MARKNNIGQVRKAAARTLWAYAYEMIAPPDGSLADTRDLLDRLNAAAAVDGRTWTARLVTTRLMHVLIVSESPEMDLEHNRTLEAGLARLGIQHLLTAPMRVDDDVDADS
jgi:hypothetical protein